MSVQQMLRWKKSPPKRRTSGEPRCSIAEADAPAASPNSCVPPVAWLRSRSSCGVHASDRRSKGLVDSDYSARKLPQRQWWAGQRGTARRESRARGPFRGAAALHRFWEGVERFGNRAPSRMYLGSCPLNPSQAVNGILARRGRAQIIPCNGLPFTASSFTRFVTSGSSTSGGA